MATKRLVGCEPIRLASAFPIPEEQPVTVRERERAELVGRLLLREVVEWNGADLVVLVEQREMMDAM